MTDYYDGKYTYWPGKNDSVTYNGIVNWDLVFPTKEDAIGYAKEYGEDSIYIVKLEKIEEPKIDADILLERLSENYCWDNDIEECGLEDVDKEKVQELENSLNKVFKEWLEKNAVLNQVYRFEDGEAIFLSTYTLSEDIPEGVEYIN